MAFKQFVRKFIPVRAATFLEFRKHLDSRLNEIDKLLSDMNTSTLSLNAIVNESIDKRVADTNASVLSLDRTIDDRIRKALETSAAATIEPALSKVDRSTALLAEKANLSIQLARTNNSLARELIWATIFNSTIAGNTWMQGVSFSPGRWAVGYPFLYVLFRVLNDFRPQSILELGLGQTTTMISQYAKELNPKTHIVVEHDQSWIDFYTNEYPVPDCTEILRLDLAMSEIEGCSHKVRTYNDFEEKVGAERSFDLIVVDGPFGYDMSELSRIDILSIVPESLRTSFVILVDDCERAGEQGMIARLKEKLAAGEIDYVEGRYEGEKKMTLICSPDLSFLTSL